MQQPIKPGDLVRAKYASRTSLFTVEELRGTKILVSVNRQWHFSSAKAGTKFELSLDLVELAKSGDTKVTAKVK